MFVARMCPPLTRYHDQDCGPNSSGRLCSIQLCAYLSSDSSAGAREQVRPVPSGSTLKALMTPSSTRAENLLQRTPPRGAMSMSTPKAFANSACSCSGRTHHHVRAPHRCYCAAAKRGTNHGGSKVVQGVNMKPAFPIRNRALWVRLRCM